MKILVIVTGLIILSLIAVIAVLTINRPNSLAPDANLVVDASATPMRTPTDPDARPQLVGKIEIGMSVGDFWKSCGAVADDSSTLTDSSGSTQILINRSTDYKGDKRPYECVGVFKFVNGKLDSITQ